MVRPALTVSPSRLALLAWAFIGIVLLASMTRPAANLPGDKPWLRRFQTPEITQGRIVGQTFVMNRDGLDAIEFHPAPTGQATSGDIALALLDTPDHGTAQLVRSGVIHAADLAQKTAYRFEFAPIADSRNRAYRFEVTGTGATSGVSLVAARGEGYSRGTLTFNGTSRWADLAFQASAPTTSIGRALWTARRPSGFPHGKFALVLLVASWLALGMVFRAFSSLSS